MKNLAARLNHRKPATAQFWLWLLLSFLFLHSALQAEKLAWQDINGTWHVIEREQFPKTRTSPHGSTIVPKTTGGITFSVTFRDVVDHNNIGFDDPTQGATRRNTITAVFAYINSVLGESGACDVEFTASETDGAGPLAFAGSTYSTGEPLFASGAAFEHIHQGTDPSPGSWEIQATVDFGRNWNAGLNAPASNQFDLFSVLLHEITHGLGIASVSNSNGSSALDFGNGEFRFTTYDDLLYTSQGTKLWNGSGTFIAPVSALTGSPGSVEFRGTQALATLGIYPSVYTPNPWRDGSSLSHWVPSLLPTPIMLPAIGTGAQIRQYQPFEISALNDLGYKLHVNRALNWTEYD